MHAIAYACSVREPEYSFNTMPKLINCSDWSMVMSQSFENHEQAFSVGERSGERQARATTEYFPYQGKSVKYLCKLVSSFPTVFEL
ncbi:hypothetical protein TNCV_2039241 [Trichonephila clavipes]|nr:hypothetical protein TNCV_2039241 [Trichonephila clavipes]